MARESSSRGGVVVMAEDKTPGEGIAEGQDKPNTTATSNDSTAILLTPVSTRTCGSECWCHVGNWAVPYPHEAYMDTLARELRVLEVAGGVLAI